MCGGFGEGSFCCNVRPRIVELTQQVYEENIENVLRAVFEMWPGTGMEFFA
jgi:hypothetical protein